MLEQWDYYYSNCEPIGHHLRKSYPERWVRFHSLPESKRYPENEGEYREILARHYAVLKSLTSSEKSVVLVTTGYTASPIPQRTYEQLSVLDPAAEHWRTCLYDEDDLFYWHFYASKWQFIESQFERLFRLVADDQIANVLIVSADCHWVFHPYDGGMDVILSTLEERQRLRQKFPDWLPQNPHGL